MLLDIQGMGYKLFDPEIATTNVKDEASDEIFFFAVAIVQLLALMLSL